MTIDVCCLIFTLLSANISDLSQTARFTHLDGYYEQNPLAKWLVDGPGAGGEIMSGVVAVLVAREFEQRPTVVTRLIVAGWALGHVRMVTSNENHGAVYSIVLPVLMVRW
jgi:hypothetical protein